MGYCVVLSAFFILREANSIEPVLQVGAQGPICCKPLSEHNQTISCPPSYVIISASYNLCGTNSSGIGYKFMLNSNINPTSATCIEGILGGDYSAGSWGSLGQTISCGLQCNSNVYVNQNPDNLPVITSISGFGNDLTFYATLKNPIVSPLGIPYYSCPSGSYYASTGRRDSTKCVVP